MTYFAGFVVLHRGLEALRARRERDDQTRQDLAEVRVADLVERLATESDPKAVKRLVVAIEYKEGASPAVIGAKYGWPE